uniref:Protein krueppel n=1 Tax=Clastoptera arizonana TaxID=38151 RepID=A0A1B6CW65_9HEMI
MLISKQVCRLCLKNLDESIIPLFTCFNNSILCTQVFHLTGVQICEDESLPSNICKLCHDQIKGFEKFKFQVQKTETLLQHHIDLTKKNIFQIGSQKLHSGNNLIEGNMKNFEIQSESLSSCIVEENGNVYNQISLLDLELNDSKVNVNNIQDERNKSDPQNNKIPDTHLFLNDQIHQPQEDKEVSVEQLKCITCQKKFKNKTTLRRHQVVHGVMNFHKCGECDKIFAHKHNLVKHSRIHSGIKLECLICQKSFTQPEYLKNHMLYTHSEQEPLSCDVCGKMYKTSVTLTVHKKTVHSDISKTNKVICNICGKLLSTTALLKHLKTHNINERIKCDLCHKSYKNRYIMIDHRKSHFKVPASCCDICGKTFRTNGILKNHKLTHLSEKQFSCKMCGAKFTQSAALRTHQRVHSGYEPYSCKCGEKFRWKQTFDKHLLKCTKLNI